MSLRLSHTTWDALDPYAIAEFWRQLLDWSITEADTYKPGSDECYLTSPHGYTVLFYRVPDAKTVIQAGDQVYLAAISGHIAEALAIAALPPNEDAEG